VDAVKRVRSMADDMVSRYGMAVAVSLDASNAFNSIPWARIMEALRHFEVPADLDEVIGAYLNDRWITFTGWNGEERRRVERGIPQGSVLGRSCGSRPTTPSFDARARAWFVTPTIPWC
jgi:hypothetical protein